jgi:CRP-like cAMP-binding protein
MHEALFKYIKTHSSTPLTESEMEVIKNTFVPNKLRKRQYFLEEGNVCKYVGFIVKGAMRQYSVDDKGVEHIVHLYIENYWVSDRESAVMLTPSKYNIDAWEDTELLIAK